MRSGGQQSSHHREPLSARVCDAATLLFALFTVCCHAVVGAGGSFDDLLRILAAVFLLAVPVGLGAIAFVRRGNAPNVAALGRSSAGSLGEGAHGMTSRVRVGGCALGGAVLGTYAVTGDVTHLWLGSVLLLLGALCMLARGGAALPAPEPPAASPRLELGLWGLASCAVVLVAVIQRYDHDTPFYVGLAVAAVDFPARELMLDPIHGIAGLGLHQPAHRIHTIELLSAVFSSLTGLSAFVAMQAVTTSIAALLVPLAFARLFREVSPRVWLGSVAVVLFVLVVAAGPNWYGNFSFARMIHGKSVFVSVFLPLAWAYGLRFGDARDAKRFVLLAAVQIAAIGCTSSALWSVPMAAGLGVASAVRLDRRAPLTLLLGLVSSTYVVVAGLSLVGDMGAVAASVARSPLPGQRLADAISWTLPAKSLAMFAWGSMLVAWALSRGLAQRFAVVVPLVVLLTVLNPFLENEVQRFVTGPAYRRAMWALPLPVLMSLVLMSPRAIAPTRRFLGPALVVAASLAFAFLIPGHYGLSEANRVTLGAPRLKVHPREYAAAARLAASAPEDAAVLAPQNVALWLPSFHRHPKILYARESYLQRVRTMLGPEEADTRMRLSEAVSFARTDIEKRTRESQDYHRRRALGMSEGFFRAKLRHYDVRAVALNERAPLAPKVRSALEKEGFIRAEKVHHQELWVLGTP